VPFHTSDTVMRLDEVPERMVIIGGGFIAAELAHVFGSFGSDVSLVTRGPCLLSGHDPDVRGSFTNLMADRFDVHLHSHVAGVTTHRDRALVAVEEQAGRMTKLEADVLLVATGRMPNGDQLHVEKTGVGLDEGGFIRTDATLETSVPGIFALGDIRTPHMLKHVANHEARVVRHNLLEPATPQRIEERFVPHAVFGHPQVASVGMTEDEARAAGHDPITSTADYGGTAYGWALEDTTSFCKVIADRRTRRLLGAHIIGTEASLLVQQLVQGMRFDLTVEHMARDQMYIHPALSEVVENALLGLPGVGYGD
jgi:mycothione reductase